MAQHAKVKNVEISVGDNVKAVTMYKDGEKLKKQVFAGKVIAIKNSGANKSFTVRKMTVSGIGVERIFPVEWPYLDSITVTSHDTVRRAKLYYMRERVGKAAQVA